MLNIDNIKYGEISVPDEELFYYATSKIGKGKVCVFTSHPHKYYSSSPDIYIYSDPEKVRGIRPNFLYILSDIPYNPKQTEEILSSFVVINNSKNEFQILVNRK